MIIALVGPTAAGKTALSLEVADVLGGPDCVEIISADAMQLYRGMDIGTAKIAPSERRGIVHHQLDVLDVIETASVAAYQRYAREDLEGIIGRGKTPIIVGGSGLYIAGLLDELEFPGHDEAIRSELEAELEERGIGALLSELRQKDPRAAEVINPANTRRIMRALEVIRLTGGQFTAKFPRHTSHYPDIRMYGVMRDQALLDKAIEQRTASMIADGLIEETRHLLDAGLREGKTARSATGYSQAMSVIEGTLSIDEAEAEICNATRKLVKKQRTWFRADPRISWIDLSSGDISSAAQLMKQELFAQS